MHYRRKIKLNLKKKKNCRNSDQAIPTSFRINLLKIDELAGALIKRPERHLPLRDEATRFPGSHDANHLHVTDREVRRPMVEEEHPPILRGLSTPTTHP